MPDERCQTCEDLEATISDLEKDLTAAEEALDAMRQERDEAEEAARNFEGLRDDSQAQLSEALKERDELTAQCVAYGDEVRYLRGELKKWEGGAKWLSVKS